MSRYGHSCWLWHKTSTKQTNSKCGILLKGSKFFFFRAVPYDMEKHSPHQMISLEYLQFFIMHLYTLRNGSYAYAWCHSHQTQGFGSHLISTYGLMASCLCNKCIYFITWLLLWILFVIYVLCLSCCYVYSLQHCVPAWKGLTSWHSCMWCFLVFLSLSHVVSWVRCGTWFYWFLIFALFLTLMIRFLSSTAMLYQTDS